MTVILFMSRYDNGKAPITADELRKQFEPEPEPEPAPEPTPYTALPERGPRCPYIWLMDELTREFVLDIIAGRVAYNEIKIVIAEFWRSGEIEIAIVLLFLARGARW